MAYRKTQNTKSDPATGRRVSMWTPKLISQVYRLYVVDQLSMEKTARRLHCSTSTVQQLLESRGWNRRIPRHKQKTLTYLEANKAKALAYYKTHSAKELADFKDLSLRGVIEWLKKEGVFLDSPKARVAKAMVTKRHAASRRLEEAAKSLLDFEASHPSDYTRAVRRITAWTYRRYRALIDPKGRRSVEIPLDHILSIRHGWENNVPLWAVAHPANLRLLPRYENTRRHNTKDPLCSDVAALKMRIKAFNNQHGDPYGR